MNAVRHGLFSRHLFLEGEPPEEYHVMLEDLHSTLRPVGTLEQGLVERIAVNMWRQRRLVQAETALLDLERRPQKIAKATSRELERGWNEELKEEELGSYNENLAGWCQRVIDEFDARSEITLDALAKQSPSIHGQLVEDAKSSGVLPEAYLTAYDGGLQEYVLELVRWCRGELDKANQRPRILATAQKVWDRKVILPDNHLELLARYQTTLDNQLYKAMKALRETQEWRLKTMEGVSCPNARNVQEEAMNAA
ncbi:MAG: hypothetical protein HQL76_17075 [Magnetococcales bacterium]|nr:hypothetical protein [Magnetococcales bacterium]